MVGYTCNVVSFQKFSEGRERRGREGGGGGSSALK